MVNNTSHRKLNVEQHEHYKNTRVNSQALWKGKQLLFHWWYSSS